MRPYHFGSQILLHRRNDERSAVSIAAALQRLRLEDHATGQVHNHTEYTPIDELVGTFTMSPFAAPFWAEDPEQLWNRADRSDPGDGAPVARQIVVSLPPMFNEDDAVILAERLARVAVTQLATCVSVAVYDMWGNEPDGSQKPEQRPLQIHLLLPMRVLRMNPKFAPAPDLTAAAQGFGETVPARAVKHVRSLIDALLQEAWLAKDSPLFATIKWADDIDDPSDGHDHDETDDDPALAFASAA